MHEQTYTLNQPYMRVQNGKKGGTIEISYFSDEDLNRILEIFELLSV